MARHRQSRLQRRRDRVWAVQKIRLDQIARGESTPRCNREEMYLRLLREGRRADIHDFILSEPLFWLERIEWERDGC